LDQQAWTFRRTSKGRKSRWLWHAGPAFPAFEPAAQTLLQGYEFERIIVQSVLPMSGNGKFISFAIASDFTAEDFASLSDPDPDD